MPYIAVLNGRSALSPQEAIEMAREFALLRAELDDIRTKYAAVLAKLDADVGVTDTNYVVTAALAAKQFTPT